jgi:hypothetical protein
MEKMASAVKDTLCIVKEGWRYAKDWHYEQVCFVRGFAKIGVCSLLWLEFFCVLRYCAGLVSGGWVFIIISVLLTICLEVSVRNSHTLDELRGRGREPLLFMDAASVGVPVAGLAGTTSALIMLFTTGREISFTNLGGWMFAYIGFFILSLIAGKDAFDKISAVDDLIKSKTKV